jgi:regulatory protein
MPTVVTVKTGADPDTARYGLSDGSVFFVRLSYAPADPLWAELVPDAEVDAEAFAWLALQFDRFRAERAALRLIARSEQHRGALARKLAQRGLGPVAATVLDRLEGIGLVDDSRFAALWLAARLGRKPAGRRRLVLELRARGLDPDVAAAAVAAAVDDERELDNLRRFLAAARLDPADIDARARAKIAAAGFRPALVRRLGES